MATVPQMNAIERRRMLAQALLSGGLNPGPIQHPLQSLGALAQTLAGSLMQRGAEKAETQRNEAANASLANVLAGGGINPQAAVETLGQFPELAPQLQFAAALQPKPTKEFDILSPTEVTKLGLDPKVRYQRESTTGRVYPIGSGSGVTVNVGQDGAIPLDKPTATDMRKVITEGQMVLDRVRQINENFDPSFLTWAGKLEAGLSTIKEKMGVDLTADQQKQLANFTEFSSTAIRQLNDYIKMVTGAAMTEAEAARIRQGIPDPQQDSPTVFMSKMSSLVQDLTRTQARAYYTLNNGLKLDEVSLSQMDNIINTRGKALEQEAIRNGASPEQAKAIAFQGLQREFGL